MEGKTRGERGKFKHQINNPSKKKIETETLVLNSDGKEKGDNFGA